MEVPILKTTASQKEGITTLFDCIKKIMATQPTNSKRLWLLAEKAYYLIKQKRMKDVDKAVLKKRIEENTAGFNLYSFIEKYY
jgi:LAO/AO transport system kinase